MAGKKLKIGWFSFTCCEDNTMVWIELMNSNYFRWKELLEIRHARVLRRNNKLNSIDVAFVEGAITNERDAKKLISIRKNAKRLVTVGSCAVNGMPAAQRNMFDDKMKEDIKFLLTKFKQSDKVRSVKEIVKVDDEVPGCPMQEEMFLNMLDKYLKEFGVIDAR